MGCAGAKAAAAEPGGGAPSESGPGLPARAQAQGSTPHGGHEKGAVAVDEMHLEAAEADAVPSQPADDVREAGEAIGVRLVEAVASAPATSDPAPDGDPEEEFDFEAPASPAAVAAPTPKTAPKRRRVVVEDEDEED